MTIATAPASESTLPDATRRRLEQLGTASIVLGIFNPRNVASAAQVVETAAQALAEHFPGRRAVILNLSGDARAAGESARSPDGITVVSSEMPARAGPESKTGALRTVLEAMARADAQAGALLGADLSSFAPAWIERLVGPILQHDFGLVAGNYLPPKYDGTLNSFIAYPLTSALYGLDVRYPIGGDYAFSADLARLCLEQDVWGADPARFDPDLWLVTTAIARGYHVAQAHLGVKTLGLGDPDAATSRRVVGTLFDLMERYADVWRSVSGSALHIPPSSGQLIYADLEPASVDAKTLVRAFRQGARRHAATINRVLAGTNIRPEFYPSTSDHHIPAALWADLVCHFALAYHRRSVDRDELLDALAALFYARTAAAIEDGAAMSAPQFEQLIVRFQAGLFQVYKLVLLDQWEG